MWGAIVLLLQMLHYTVAAATVNYFKKRKRKTDSKYSYGRKKMKHSNWVDRKERDYAVLSKAAYSGSNYLKRKVVRELDTQGKWTLNNKLSHAETSVFESGNQVVIAYRGTKLNQDVSTLVSGDLSSDLLLAIGGEGYLNRFKDASSEFQRIRESYGSDKEYILTGHSLGGSIARYVHNANKNDVKESHLFNPGAGMSAIFDPSVYDNMYVYHVSGDAISVLANYNDSNVTSFDAKSGSGSHTVDNFL